MTETIAEVAFRLAREQLAAAKDERPEPLPTGRAMPPLHTETREEADPREPGVQVGSADDAAGDHGVSSGQTASSDPPGLLSRQHQEIQTWFSSRSADSATPPGPPLRRGGDDVRPVDGFGFDDEAGMRQTRPSTEHDLIFRSPAGESPAPPLFRGGEGVRPATVFESDDAPHSTPPSGNGAGYRGVPQLVETIGEHGRRIEEVLSELERSLTTMFNTQLEAFRQLRDYAQDQERRWVEQTANRRAAFSPP